MMLSQNFSLNGPDQTSSPSSLLCSLSDSISSQMNDPLMWEHLTARKSRSSSRRTSLSLWELFPDEFKFTPIKTSTKKSTSKHPTADDDHGFLTPPPSAPGSPVISSTTSSSSARPTFSNKEVLLSPQVDFGCDDHWQVDAAAVVPEIDLDLDADFNLDLGDELWDQMLLEDKPILLEEASSSCSTIVMDDEMIISPPSYMLTPPPSSSTCSLVTTTKMKKRKLQFDCVDSEPVHLPTPVQQQKSNKQRPIAKAKRCKSSSPSPIAKAKRCKSSSPSPIAKAKRCKPSSPSSCQPKAPCKKTTPEMPYLKSFAGSSAAVTITTAITTDNHTTSTACVKDFDLTAFFDCVAIDCGSPGIDTVTNGKTSTTTIIGITNEKPSMNMLSPTQRRQTPYPHTTASTQPSFKRFKDNKA